MARALLLLVCFAALSAWAGAQGPAPLPAAVQVKLFKNNRALLDNLINHGLDLSDTDDPLDRAQECRRTAQTLANYLERAATDAQDPDRVAELADLLGDVVREGLTPNLETAKQLFPPGTKRFEDVKQLRDTATRDLDAVAPTIPAGKVAENTKVKDALARLATLKAALGK